MLDLSAAGTELIRIAGRMSGQRAVLAADILQAGQAIAQATGALDHFTSRNKA